MNGNDPVTFRELIDEARYTFVFAVRQIADIVVIDNPVFFSLSVFVECHPNRTVRSSLTANMGLDGTLL